MISVVIPTLNAAQDLPDCLSALMPALIEGLVKEAIISDGGSSDETLVIAEAAGARIITGAKGRGGQLARGAGAARGRWLLFLHADTQLSSGWEREAAPFLKDETRAGVFTLKFASRRLAARVVEAGAMLRTRLFAAPYGDQGLLVSRPLYDSVGGISEKPLFEDVDFIDRLIAKHGRRALHVFRAEAVTSPARYEREGYGARVLRNAACLAMYRFGVSPAKIAEFYARS